MHPIIHHCLISAVHHPWGEPPGDFSSECFVVWVLLCGCYCVCVLLCGYCCGYCVCPICVLCALNPTPHPLDLNSSIPSNTPINLHIHAPASRLVLLSPTPQPSHPLCCVTLPAHQATPAMPPHIPPPRSAQGPAHHRVARYAVAHLCCHPGGGCQTPGVSFVVVLWWCFLCIWGLCIVLWGLWWCFLCIWGLSVASLGGRIEQQC